MLVTTRQRRTRVNDDLNISLNDIQLLTVSNEKVLGVQIDNNISWGKHVRKITKKMSTNIWLLSKVKTYLSTEYRVMYYKSYIQPHLDYANIVWSSMSKTNLMQIERLCGGSFCFMSWCIIFFCAVGALCMFSYF